MSWIKINDDDGRTYGLEAEPDPSRIVTLNGLNDRIVEYTTKIEDANNILSILESSKSGMPEVVIQAIDNNIGFYSSEISNWEFQKSQIQDLINEITNG